MLRRPLSFVALTVLAALGACVAVAAFAAPSRASAHTGVACPLSRLTAAKSFKGVASLSYVHSASGSTPGAGGSKTIALDRKLQNTSLTLPRMRSRVPGLLLFGGKGHGGTLSIDDTVAYSKSGQAGTLQGNGAPTAVNAMAVFLLGECKAWFAITYSGRGTYSGDPGFRPGATVGGVAFSYPDETPSAKTFSSVEPVPALDSGCSPTFSPPPTEGCYMFSGSWANDFATLAHCKSIVAADCAPDDEPIGKALLRWSLKPSFK